MHRLLLILIIVILPLWLSGCEPVERKVYTGLRGEAAANKLLAAYRYLKNSGWQVNKTARPLRYDTLPDDMIILATDRATLGPDRSQKLLAWVEKGGILVTGGRPEIKSARKHSRTDHLFDALYLQQEKLPASYSASIDFFGTGESLRVKTKSGIRLTYLGLRGASMEGDDVGAFLIRIPHGKGEVLAVSDLDIFDNLHIGEHDHAALLSRIAYHYEPARILIIYRENVNSFISLTMRYTWPFWLALAVITVFWFWSGRSRFGSLLPADTAIRRSLMEHIVAGGRLMWRHGAREPLHKAVRQQLFHLLEVRYPAWAALERTELVSRLADATRWNEQQINFALDAHCEHERDFTQAVTILEDIRKTL